MRMSLEVVMVAVILLVMAVVLIAFFVNGLRPGVEMTDARNTCITMASASCQSFKAMPPTWSIPTINTKSGLQSCEQITKIGNDCKNFGVTTGGGTPAGGGATPGGGGTGTPITTKAACDNKGGHCQASCIQGSQTQLGTCSDNPATGVCCQ